MMVPPPETAYAQLAGSCEKSVGTVAGSSTQRIQATSEPPGSTAETCSLTLKPYQPFASGVPGVRVIVVTGPVLSIPKPMSSVAPTGGGAGMKWTPSPDTVNGPV